MHPVMLNEIIKELEKSMDVTGYKHLSMNTWMIVAFKEKIDKDKKSGSL